MRAFYLGAAAVSVAVVGLAAVIGWAAEQLVVGTGIGLVLVCAGLPASVGWMLHREMDTRYRRLEAWIATYSVIRPRAPLPWPRPYMASPELLRTVAQLVMQHRPRVVLELGSGVSSVVAAYALDALQQGNIVSVDHEQRFCRATRALISEHALDQWCTVIHAPLTKLDSGGRRSSWYDPKPIERALDMLGRIDLLIVDGPPGPEQALARRPALFQLHQRLAPTAVIVVDDARRSDEREMVRDWMSAHPELSADYLDTEKGAIVLRRDCSGASVAPRTPVDDAERAYSKGASAGS